MNNRLHSHHCRRCTRSYFSPDSNKVYCSSSCEGRDQYEDLYPHAKKKPIKNNEVKPEPLTFDRKPDAKTQEILDSNERWGKRKHPSERPRQDLQKAMYRDTFKKWIPKRLKVMRG